MRCVSILVSLSFAGAASVQAGSVDIEFSEQLRVLDEGVYVPEYSGESGVADAETLSEPTVLEVEATNGASSVDTVPETTGLVVETLETLSEPAALNVETVSRVEAVEIPSLPAETSPEGAETQAETTVSDIETVAAVVENAAGEDDVADAQVADVTEEDSLLVELPADLDLNGPSILETVPIVGSFDFTELAGETLDIPELPQELQGAWDNCDAFCRVPGVDMFEVWEELSSAAPEGVLTDLEAEPLNEQQPAHASLPATAVLLGGAIGALAFRRRRKTRAMGG